jgi:hypothetical protein
MAYGLDDQHQAHLGRTLRAVYQPVVEETLPVHLRNWANSKTTSTGLLNGLATV